MTSNSTGIQFPADASGNRSTGQLAKQVVADALATVDPAAAGRVPRIRHGRKACIPPVTGRVAAGVDGPAAWDGVARTALESLQSRMVGVHETAGQLSETPVKDYLAVVAPSTTPSTETIHGTA